MQPKILLVDDREDNLFSMETILEPKGYHFVKARSGREALKILLTEFDFAMILMDVKMPNLNGFETASLIYERDRLKHIPIIFITANNFGDENLYKGYQAGAVDYIFKPVNPNILRAKVTVLVDLYQKTQKLQQQEQKLTAINKNLEMEIAERIASEGRVRDLNRQLVENIERLESVNKELDRFAFMASHDLQEPLRKIRLFASKLLIKYHNQLDNEGKNDFERIEKAAERMQTLIHDILTFSRISEEPVAFVPTDIGNIVQDVIHELEEEIGKKQAQITVSKLPQAPINPGLLKLLFHNLIGNALKYSKKDVPPEISIRLEEAATATTDDAPKYFRILIKDNGLGFDQRYAEEIFGMFKRLHQETRLEGTGIGLALCKRIAEHHNGFISALSKVNEGSVFIVSLPLSQKSVPKLQTIPVV
jgi:light-regulated signal transduction histidine kinase (bacteriophytochrome)